MEEYRPGVRPEPDASPPEASEGGAVRLGVPNPAGVLPSGSTPEEVEARLAAIDHALQRLEAGTYWSCEECGAPFEEADLRADPAASLCGEHAGKAPGESAGGAA